MLTASVTDLEVDGGSACFSDEGSCNGSHFYSTADGEDYGSEILEESSSMADPEPDPDDLEHGLGVFKKGVENLDRVCRICHLSLLTTSPGPGSGIAIQLGCSCKDELAAAHKQCAETWFKIKGDKTCEICNSIAQNVVGPNDIEAGVPQPQPHQVTDSPAAAVSVTPQTRSCINGHRLLNFLLACMVFAFVISWLFHFNIPS